MAPSDLPPIYAGPSVPRWLPQTIADVQDAFSTGSLTENHWVDAKRELKSTSAANKELARDIAAFAIDSGCLVVGVEEDKDAQTFTVRPVALNGLAEKVDQVARTHCDPPLFVTCRPIPDAQDPTRGVLLVEVPAGPLAPHMVDHAYWGRNDTTKHKLSDNEVERLHAVRRARHLTIHDLIEKEIARDPVPIPDRHNAHLFGVAQPLGSRVDLLTDALEKQDFDRLVLETLWNSNTDKSRIWENLQTHERRARGRGWASSRLAARVPPADLDPDLERQLLDLEVSDDGAITCYTGGASAIGPDGKGYLLVPNMIVATRSLAALAGKIGATYGYNGRWLIGVGATNMQGKQSARAQKVMSFSELPAFSEPSYVYGTEASTVELVEDPRRITQAVLFRLLRALGESADQLDSIS